MTTTKAAEAPSTTLEGLVGSNLIIRTVTMHHVGRLVAVNPTELVIDGAAWIADSGRWAKALRTGSFNEVELFDEGLVFVGRGAIVDAAVYRGPMPSSTV